MQKQVLEAVNNAVETAYAASKEVIDINTNAVESLIEKQLDVLSQTVDFGVKQAKLVGEVKDVKAALSAQTQLMESVAEQAVENVRDVMAIANKTRAAYDKLVNKGVKEAVAAIKPKASQKAA